MTRPSRADRAATAATRLLDAVDVSYTVHRYRYEEHGGTRVASRELGLDEHTVIKTLVMEDENCRPLVVLMHGDREVATGRLARQIGCKRVASCVPEVAARHSGYLVGGTSPFGLRKPMPLFIERTILDLLRVFVNGGSRGLLLGIAPGDLDRVLKPTPVDAAAGGSGL
jgi:Cys-tRNA(Pro) deacylase